MDQLLIVVALAVLAGRLTDPNTAIHCRRLAKDIHHGLHAYCPITPADLALEVTPCQT